MLSEGAVRAVISEMGIPIAGAVVSEFDSEVSYVFVSVFRDQENRQQPPNSLLNSARSRLKDLGRDVEFLLVDASSQEMESGLRATLRHSFDRELRNVFLSWEGKKAKVWVEPKYSYQEEIGNAITKKIVIYLSQLDIQLDSVVRTTEESLPTMLACLNRIRLLAPFKESALYTDLVSRGFSIPSPDWLKRRLESMRRAGRLVRLADASYALTLSSLRALGMTRGKSSPDITRMLALARRRE